MSYIPDNLRQLVINRADNRCEYCRLAQAGQEATFHIDHIIPVIAGGKTSSRNLALACVSCSLRKAARLVAIDPLTSLEVPLFHPRRAKWRAHFKWDELSLVGLTSIGRATISALEMNRAVMLAIRAEEKWLGRHLH